MRLLNAYLNQKQMKKQKDLPGWQFLLIALMILFIVNQIEKF